MYEFEGARGGGGGGGESGRGAGKTADVVMQSIEGQTLAEYNNATSHIRELLSAAAVICLFTPISLALDYAHRQGVIHRDIKPRNVLFDQTEMSRNPMGKPILTDFGFAKLLSAMAQTIGGTVLGMPLYLSPTQVQDKPVSSRSDLYSLGVMLSEV